MLYILTLNTCELLPSHMRTHFTVHKNTGPPTLLLKILWSARAILMAWTSPGNLVHFCSSFFFFRYYLYEIQHTYNVHNAHTCKNPHKHHRGRGSLPASPGLAQESAPLRLWAFQRGKDVSSSPWHDSVITLAHPVSLPPDCFRARSLLNLAQSQALIRPPINGFEYQMHCLNLRNKI